MHIVISQQASYQFDFLFDQYSLCFCDSGSALRELISCSCLPSGCESTRRIKLDQAVLLCSLAASAWAAVSMLPG